MAGVPLELNGGRTEGMHVRRILSDVGLYPIEAALRRNRVTYLLAEKITSRQDDGVFNERVLGR